jgi:hypothetical protein
MKMRTTRVPRELTEAEWLTFPGGELEGKRPRALCPACRTTVAEAFRAGDGAPGARRLESERRTLCFGCYRAEIARERAIAAAGQLDTASEDRFQTALPFEPINRPRLEMLKVERLTSRRAAASTMAGRLEERRRQAQTAARQALQRIAAGLALRHATRADHARVMATAIHAAELQLPESWLPFVVSR